MNPRELTLEQMEEREANRIAFQKAKAESAIAKLSDRVKDQKDQKEIDRLNGIIQTHSYFKAELETVDIKVTALSKYNVIQEKLSGRITPIKEGGTIIEDIK